MSLAASHPIAEALRRGEMTTRMALDYAEHGWLVFPLGPNKRPLALCARCRIGCPGRDACMCPVDTCHGFWAATREPERIRRWFSRCPDWQLGIRTGAVSGLVVVDVDAYAGGTATWDQLERDLGAMASTVTQLSGSGQSTHRFYAHPGHTVPTSAGRLGAGLDVRGDGGNIVAAPTVHPATGRRYKWNDDPFAPLLPWPRALDHLLRNKATRPLAEATAPATSGTRTQARLTKILDIVLTASEGERNDRVHWAACRLGEMVAAGHISPKPAVKALLEAGRAIGLTDAELLGNGEGGTIFSGLNQGRAGGSS